MTKKLTPLPDVTYVSGRVSLRLLDVKVMDYGVLHLEVHLAEAIRQTILEFLQGRRRHRKVRRRGRPHVPGGA